MSLNKTRKRAIARARKRIEIPEQELLSGYRTEQIAEAIQAIQAIGCAAQAVIDGLVAFGKAFSESMTRQMEERI